jgi:hypothetical protein
MGLKIASLSAAVGLNNLGAIHGDALEGIDGNKYNTTVGIYTVLSISVANGMEN